MFTAIEFKKFCENHHVSAAAFSLIQNIRSSDPARRVRSTSRSVATRFASRKMGCVIQADSKSVELPFVHSCEYSDSTFEFWDQTQPIELRYPDKNGRPIRVFQTPDYFVLSSTFIGWVDCKPEDECEKKPNFYTKIDGKWRSLPGEQFAAQFGLEYRVVTEKEFNPIFLKNLADLSDFITENAPLVAQDTQSQIQEYVQATPFVWYRDLILPSGEFSSDDVLTMIAERKLWVDLDSVLLTETPYLVKVFADEASLRAHKILLRSAELPAPSVAPIQLTEGGVVEFNGKSAEVISRSDTGVMLRPSGGQLTRLTWAEVTTLTKQGILASQESSQGDAAELAANLIMATAPRDLDEGLKRFFTLFPDKRPEGFIALPAGERTLRNWRHAFREAQKAYGLGFLGLIPRIALRGNRVDRLGADVTALIKEHYQTDFLRLPSSKSAVFGMINNECAEKGLPQASHNTLYKRFASIATPHAAIEARKGEKAAYSIEPPYLEIDLTTPRHGTRVFEIGHIDHTQADVQLVDERWGGQLGKAWLTVLLDATTRCILAWWFSFNAPSAISCMMVLRECVRQHGRIPDTIVSDGGSEFQSTDYELLIAKFESTKRSRPAHKPRNGTLIERFFGIANTQFFHQLRGNNVPLQSPRSMSPSHDPRATAIWNLRAIDTAFGNYVESVYHVNEHPALSISPIEAKKLSLAETGARVSRMLGLTAKTGFLFLPTPKGQAPKIAKNGIVRINYGEYMCNEFQQPGMAGTEVHVRYDPDDVSHAYVYIPQLKRWVECFSQYAANFKGMSEHELKLRSQQLRGKNKRKNVRRHQTMMRIATHITSTRSEEERLALERQQLRDKAASAPKNDVPSETAMPSETSPLVNWESVPLTSMGELK